MAIEYLDAAPAAAAPTSGAKFEYLDEEKPKSLAGFGQNLVTDAKDTAAGMANMVPALMEHPIDTVTGMVKNAPSGIINEGKRLGVGELLTGHPINAMEKFGNALYDKPLTTGLEVAPLAGAAGKAIFGAGAEGADAAGAAAKAGLAEDAVKAVPDVPPAGPAGPSAAAESLKTPPPATEPPTGAGAAPAAEAAAPKGPLSEVQDFLHNKYGEAAASPSWPNRLATYLHEESRKLGSKDLGLQGGQIRQMGEGFKGIEKAEALIDYARDKGYFQPSLTDVARKEMLKANLEKAGRAVGAIRDIADKRANPPIRPMLDAVESELTKKYGLKAPGEVKKTLKIIKQSMLENPTFSGVADISTDLNKELRNIRSMGRHVGPNTDAADILSRMNNDAIRTALSPEEQQLYNDSLRGYGAHKKLEKAVAGSGRRELGARSNQRGILGRLWQEALDRGGYRMAGNVAHRTANAIMDSPSKAQSLPKFFEELVHQSEDVLDETLHPEGMAHGGIVADDELNDFLSKKYGKGE